MTQVNINRRNVAKVNRNHRIEQGTTIVNQTSSPSSSGGGSGSGSTSNIIQIPNVQLFVRRDSNIGNQDLLFARLIDSDLSFADYNPELWLFRWVHANQRTSAAYSYFLHERYTRWSHPYPDKFYDHVTRDTVFTSPAALNEVVRVDVNLSDWVMYEFGNTVATMKRKARTKLHLNIDPQNGAINYPGDMISVNFGLAVCIDNPLLSDTITRPLKIWGNVSPFRIYCKVITDSNKNPMLYRGFKLIK